MLGEPMQTHFYSTRQVNPDMVVGVEWDPFDPHLFKIPSKCEEIFFEWTIFPQNLNSPDKKVLNMFMRFLCLPRKLTFQRQREKFIKSIQLLT